MAKRKRSILKVADEKVSFGMNKPVYRLDEYTTFIYGPPKIGKTTLACSWPNPITLACEPRGIRALPVRRAKIRNWSQFRGSVVKLGTKKYKGRFQTAIIDTADLGFNYCLNWCGDRYGFEHPSDEGWGKGWHRVQEEYLAQILRLFDLGLAVVFISHSVDKDISTEFVKFTRTEPTLRGTAKRTLLPLVDVIFYMYPKVDRKTGKSVRYVTTRATREYEAGDRTRCLTDMTIKIPRKEQTHGYEIINRRFQKHAKTAKDNAQKKSGTG